MNRITVAELQRVVLRLANQCPTRYWLHRTGNPEDGLMSIQTYDMTNRAESGLMREMEAIGFTLHREEWENGRFVREWRVLRADPPRPTPTDADDSGPREYETLEEMRLRPCVYQGRAQVVSTHVVRHVTNVVLSDAPFPAPGMWCNCCGAYVLDKGNIVDAPSQPAEPV